ncbi:class I SAM-dependent methyltransferase [Halogeometricum limi]|uniref:Methyltransferase domain-containing protein n=1 Tax=Halogeometricum limi TaxID=555875 RepID=A0A1I6FSV3_9EURY|nr:class I SAM-dependent methyltransferase [Halogeometricum limi]SFR33025.1 hypothetical protein SAMN04488124_0227 [Halogeometricum limi]
MKGDFQRYLRAKETVDDRAFDPRVRRAVRSDLAARSGTVRLLDAGAGTGPFLRRLLTWDDVPDLTYVAVDADETSLELGARLVEERARELRYSVDTDGSTPENPAFDVLGDTLATLSLRGRNAVDVRFVRADALDAADAGGWTVVVAQAFVDLLGPDEVDRLLAGLVSGGRFYFPITFDGGTAFAPGHDADDAVLAAYHDTMHAGDRWGSRAGRRLESHLDSRGVDYVAGDSDWHVRPVGGAYPADEAAFLRTIVDTVGDAVRGHVDEVVRATWLTARRRQLAERTLEYVAKNRDVSGRVGSTTPR